MTASEISPCPFCGSTKITVEWEPCPPMDETDTNRRWFAECTQCSCQGPFCQKEPHVIPAWNNRASAHARKSQPNERLLKAAKDARNIMAGYYVEGEYVELVEAISAAESAAPGVSMEVELANALNALLDGLDANSDPESGRLSHEQWHHRIASARLVLHRFDRMEQRREAQATISKFDDARKTEGAK